MTPFEREDADDREETVIIRRRDRRRARAAADGGLVAPVGVDEATVVIDRSAGGSAESEAADEATILVDRAARLPEETLVEEITVAASRPKGRLLRRKNPPATEGGLAVTPAPEARPGPGSFAAPMSAPTPAIYKPRPAPLAPSAPPVVVGAAAPTRAAAPQLPSVVKRARRRSMATLLVFAGACVVSVAGLLALTWLTVLT